MKVAATESVVKWQQSLQRNSPQHLYLMQALRFLALLEEEPDEDLPPVLVKVRQARRHRIWRVSHPFHEGVAVRVLAWFPQNEDTVVVALAAGDKGRVGDVWYDHNTRAAEQAVDDWIRRHP